MLSTARACRTGVIRFPRAAVAGPVVRELLPHQVPGATESATEGCGWAQDTGQPVREAGPYGMLALLAAIAGDEVRCRELAASALRLPPRRSRTSAPWRSGRWPCSISAWAVRCGAQPVHDRDRTAPALYPSRSCSHRTRLRRPCDSARLVTSAPTGPRSRWTLHRLGRSHRLSRGHGPCCTAARLCTQEGTRRPTTARRCGCTRSAAVRSENSRTELLDGEWLRRDRRARMPALTCGPRSLLFDRTGAAPWAERTGPSCARQGSPRPPGVGAGPAEPAHTAGTPGRSAGRFRRDQPGHRRPVVHQPLERSATTCHRAFPKVGGDQPDLAGPPRPHRPGRSAVAAARQSSVRYTPAASAR